MPESNKKIIKVIRKKVEKKDGTYFTTYKLVEENGKLVDLVFLKSVDLSKFDGMYKFNVQVGSLQAKINYEYPKYFCSEVDYDTISKII